MKKTFFFVLILFFVILQARTQTIQTAIKKDIKYYKVEITRYYFGRENIRITITQDEIISESSIAVNKKYYSLTKRNLTAVEKADIKKFLSGFPLGKFKENYYNKGVKDGMQLLFKIRINDLVKNIHLANYYIKELGNLTEEIKKLLPEDFINYSKDSVDTEREM